MHTMVHSTLQHLSREFDSRVSKLTVMTSMGYDCFNFEVLIFFSDLDVGACIFLKKVPIETFNI